MIIVSREMWISRARYIIKILTWLQGVLNRKFQILDDSFTRRYLNVTKTKFVQKASDPVTILIYLPTLKQIFDIKNKQIHWYLTCVSKLYFSCSLIFVQAWFIARPKVVCLAWENRRWFAVPQLVSSRIHSRRLFFQAIVCSSEEEGDKA